MNDKYRGEHVLVFERSLLLQLGSFNGTTTEVERYLGPILDKRNNRFHPRYLAEDDPSLQQIIPYVVFRHGDTVFSYVRGKQSGETRLVGNRSIGVGGHINPKDEQLFKGTAVASDRDAYLEAVRREIAEEVVIDGQFEPRVVALLKDDSNAVGSVHFGVIHVCDLKGPFVRKREQQLTLASFMPLAELAGPRLSELETWSQLCVQLLLAC